MWRAGQEELDVKKSHWADDEGSSTFYRKIHLIGMMGLGCILLIGSLLGC
jgi:hypothetical protein